MKEEMLRSTGRGVVFKTFDVKVQVQNETFGKLLLFLWNIAYVYVKEDKIKCEDPQKEGTFQRRWRQN